MSELSWGAHSGVRPDRMTVHTSVIRNNSCFDRWLRGVSIDQSVPPAASVPVVREEVAQAPAAAAAASCTVVDPEHEQQGLAAHDCVFMLFVKCVD